MPRGEQGALTGPTPQRWSSCRPPSFPPGTSYGRSGGPLEGPESSPMRHKVGQRKLHRTTSHRLAMLNNMVTSLLEHEAIRTTVPKAKEARKMAERIITLGKKGGVANVRLAARIVKDKNVLQKVFSTYKD